MRDKYLNLHVTDVKKWMEKKELVRKIKEKNQNNTNKEIEIAVKYQIYKNVNCKCKVISAVFFG